MDQELIDFAACSAMGVLGVLTAKLVSLHWRGLLKYFWKNKKE